MSDFSGENAGRASGVCVPQNRMTQSASFHQAKTTGWAGEKHDGRHHYHNFLGQINIHTRHPAYQHLYIMMTDMDLNDLAFHVTSAAGWVAHLGLEQMGAAMLRGGLDADDILRIKLLTEGNEIVAAMYPRPVRGDASAENLQDEVWVDPATMQSSRRIIKAAQDLSQRVLARKRQLSLLEDHAAESAASSSPRQMHNIWETFCRNGQQPANSTASAKVNAVAPTNMPPALIEALAAESSKARSVTIAHALPCKTAARNGQDAPDVNGTNGANRRSIARTQAGPSVLKASREATSRGNGRLQPLGPEYFCSDTVPFTSQGLTQPTNRGKALAGTMAMLSEDSLASDYESATEHYGSSPFVRANAYQVTRDATGTNKFGHASDEDIESVSDYKSAVDYLFSNANTIIRQQVASPQHARPHVSPGKRQMSPLPEHGSKSISPKKPRITSRQ